MAGTKAATGEFRKRNLVILGAVIGFLYGFGLRIVANSSLSHFAVMTMGFTCLMPFAMGCITVYFAEIGQPRRVWTWIWLPWVPLLAALGATMLAGCAADRFASGQACDHGLRDGAPASHGAMGEAGPLSPGGAGS